jgi:GT2 family glycosyltransferase
MMREKIGLVTVTFNSGEVIEAFLESVNKQDYPNFFLYIVDNNSNDETLKKIEEKATPGNTSIIKNNFNNGVAGGNNQGIKKALEDNCDYVILINNDTEFEPRLITKLLEKAKSTGHALVAPRMVYYDEPNILWFAGGFFNKRMGYMGYHVGMNEKDTGQYGDRTITYSPTCCVLIDKHVFEVVGFMDEKYFVYFDDTDFMFRVMKNSPYKMLYCKDVEFYHKVGSLTKAKIGGRSNFKFGDFLIKYSTRNCVYYLKKQKTLSAWLYIMYFWFRVNLKFLFSGKYNVNFKTWRLIQYSFFEGLKL